MYKTKLAKLAVAAALTVSVSACGLRNHTGSDPSLERIEISAQECQQRGGVTVVNKRTGEQNCRIGAEGYANYTGQGAALGAATTAAASSSGGAAAAAAVAGLGLVAVFAISNSTSGTR